MSTLGATETVRRENVRAALDRSGGNVTAAAESLGVSRQHLHECMRKMAGKPSDARASVKVTLDLPKHLKDWLEQKALDRKQAGGGRFAISPIVVEILEAVRAEEARD